MMKKFNVQKMRPLNSWAASLTFNATNESKLSRMPLTGIYGSQFSSDKNLSWEQKDKLELNEFNKEKILHKEYKKLRDLWQKPLAKKAEARERKAQRPIAQTDVNEVEKLVIHNPTQELDLSPASDEMFAVIQLGNQQYKVTQDDVIQTEKIEEDVGSQLCLDHVYLVGSAEFSALGRPLISNARVYATIEQHEKTEKVIVFKKRRRTGYQKNQGHRQRITLLRVDHIEYNPSEEALANAQPLLSDAEGNPIDFDSLAGPSKE